MNGLGSSGNIEFQADSTLQWGNPTAQWTQDLSSRLVIDAGVTATLDMGAQRVTFASDFAAQDQGSLIIAPSSYPAGGSLTLATSQSFSGSVTVGQAGTLLVGAPTEFNGGLNIDQGSVTLQAPTTIGGSSAVTQGELMVQNGLTLDGTLSLGYLGEMFFQGSQTLAGSGTLAITDSQATATIYLWDGGGAETLTVGPQITIHGLGDITEEGGDSDTLVNDGTIQADAPGDTLTISVPVTNYGTLSAVGSAGLALTNYAGTVLQQIAGVGASVSGTELFLAWNQLGGGAGTSYTLNVSGDGVNNQVTAGITGTGTIVQENPCAARRMT